MPKGYRWLRLSDADMMLLRQEAIEIMNGDSEREIAIFTQALKISPQKREAFFERACGGDEELRRKVEALLKAHGRLGNFMEEPPPGETTD